MVTSLEDLAVKSLLDLLATVLEPPVRAVYGLLIRTGVAKVVPASS